MRTKKKEKDFILMFQAQLNFKPIVKLNQKYKENPKIMPKYWTSTEQKYGCYIHF